jgi:taurine dioxygenase
MTATTVTQDTPSQATSAAPAIIRPSVRRHSIKVELSTPAIGAELSNVSLADAALDPDVIAEIRALWLKHKVLFFRDQDISPMEQQDFAAQFAAGSPSLCCEPSGGRQAGGVLPQSRPGQA